MELKSLDCPNCGANLDIEDGLDTFYCKYCGFKIVIDGQSDAAYEAKVKIKDMEHKERLEDKKNEQEKYRIESEQKNTFKTFLFCFGILAIILLIAWIINFNGKSGVEKQEKKLESTVEEIMADIEEEDFSSAYIKANSLYWDDSWTSEGKDKWDAIREETLRQIEIAEKKQKRSVNK